MGAQESKPIIDSVEHTSPVVYSVLVDGSWYCYTVDSCKDGVYLCCRLKGDSKILKSYKVQNIFRVCSNKIILYVMSDTKVFEVTVERIEESGEILTEYPDPPLHGSIHRCVQPKGSIVKNGVEMWNKLEVVFPS